MKDTGSWYRVATSVWNLLSGSEKNQFYIHSLGGFISAFLDLSGILLLVQLASMITGSDLCFNLVVVSFCFNNLMEAAAVILGFYIVKNAISLWLYHKQTKHAYSVTKRLSLKKFSETLYQNELYFMNRGLSEVYHRVSSTVLMFSEVMMMPFYTLVIELILLFVMGLGLLLFYPILFIILIALLFPVAYLFLKYKRSVTAQHNGQVNRFLPDIHEMIDEATRGHSEIALQRAQASYIGRFTTIAAALYRVRSRLYLINNGVSIRLFETIAILGLFLMVLSTLFWVEPNDVLPILALYVAAAFRIIPSLNRIANTISQLTSHEYLLELVKSDPVDKTNFESAKLTSPESIQLNEIAFKYPDRDSYVFQHLSLELTKGGMIGLAGNSGSGKTTLAKILSGLIKPDSGTISWNGEVIQNTASFQQSVYLLPQEPFIFKDTIAANVTFRVSVDSDRLTDSLKRAHLHDWVEELPLKENTLVADKGTTLSGGQKQRLSIARALYFGASVLVVDEPTNSLDEEARQTVLQTLKELSRSIIVVLISHHEDELKHCKTVISL